MHVPSTGGTALQGTPERPTLTLARSMRLTPTRTLLHSAVRRSVELSCSAAHATASRESSVGDSSSTWGPYSTAVQRYVRTGAEDESTWPGSTRHEAWQSRVHSHLR